MILSLESLHISQEDIPNNETERCQMSEWEVILDAPDRVNIPCLMHNTHLCHCVSMAKWLAYLTHM